MIIGIDEVGRGPLAGPVIACACFIPEALQTHPLYDAIKDSKKLSAKKRDEISAWLHENALFALGEASVEEIDAINILQATFLAMERAYTTLLLSFPAEPAGEGKGISCPVRSPSLGLMASPGMTVRVLIDGNRKPKGLNHAETIIGGDAHVKEIAAASIIAKVHRDAIMQQLAIEHPHYGWHSNAGYGAKVHMDAIKTHGVTIHHRRSFAPVRDYLDAAA